MSSPAIRARRGVLLTHGFLLVLVITWQLFAHPTLVGLGLALLAAVPLLLPWRGLLAGHRFTHIWSTLCVLPYLLLGMVESVANPAGRAWAAACILLSLAFFIALILYLRVTRATQPALEPR